MNARDNPPLACGAKGKRETYGRPEVPTLGVDGNIFSK